MFSINRISVERQIVVSDAVSKSVSAPRPIPLLPSTVASAEALIAAAEPLQLYVSLTDKRVKDATSAVVVDFTKSIAHLGRLLRGDIAPLGPPQREHLARLQLLQARLFPNGTDHIYRSMNMQWSSLVTLRTAMQEPACSEAIDALALRVFADHVLAYMEVYGRMLGPDAKAAGAGEEAASAAWTQAYSRFAVQVMHDYLADEATQRELLGPYEAQVTQQRAADRAAERARRARAKAEAEAEAETNGSAQAPAEQPAQPPLE